jgi:hypothetical protein
MNNLFFGFLFTGIIFNGTFQTKESFASEVIKVTQSNADFDTVIRVSVPAQIVEAADVTLLQRPAPFIQSLRYIAKKESVLTQGFSTFDEVDGFIRNQLCTEKHEVTLKPVRDAGTKGTESFLSQLHASSITVTGIHVSNKGKPFQKTISCRVKN